MCPLPAGDRIELDEGTTSELALALRDAIARNLEREEGRRARAGLGGRVLIRAEDTDRAVTIDFDRDRIRIGEGEQPAPRIRIVGDEGGRQALKRQLGGELTIRGLVLRSPSVLRFLRLLAA
jgi:hypothetical protein